MKNISERIKREREARGVSIEELAKGTFISVAVLKDIESGDFDKYKGDELYLKMYFRKIAKYLGLDEKELDGDFEALTQEIHLEEVRQDDINKRLEEENKKNVTISGKVSDTFKDLKNVKTKKPVSNKKVYEDRYLLRYFKYALVVLVAVAIIFVCWYSIVATRSPESNDFNNNNTPTVEGNNDTGKQDTTTTDNDDKKDEVVIPAIEITKVSEMNYTVKYDQEKTPTFKLKIDFVGRTWVSTLKVNGTDYEGFKSGIYNNANKSNALDAQPETVEFDIDGTTFENLELTFGYFMGHRFYINDTQLEVDPAEYNAGRKTLVITRVQ